ncbi:DUF397 domain-containing protein [Streptomyces sp. H51]|uniref:DUF397 domain-containing protein n=1 Tax=Streptomyces sp. H51 TaxID=3111770 RepID=UPI002D786899|nr:DUF397 domain-containing protein [Streptomyces sp. H51]
MIRKSPEENAATLRWFKSSHSDSSNSNECVEVASALGIIHVRDSKHTVGPRLQLSPEAWADFVPFVSEG